MARRPFLPHSQSPVPYGKHMAAGATTSLPPPAMAGQWCAPTTVAAAICFKKARLDGERPGWEAPEIHFEFLLLLATAKF